MIKLQWVIDMYRFKHNCGAVIVVDAKGHKRILKHGFEFNSFTELKLFEKTQTQQSLNFNQNSVGLRNVYRDYRQK